jgi:hypothetical protein
LRVGALLAECAGMLKSLVLVTMLCAPALADPAQDKTYAIDIATGALHQTLLVVDHSCGQLQNKFRSHDIFVRVCAVPVDASHVRLEVERRQRDSQAESNATALIVATNGTTFEVLDAKLTVKLRDAN